MGFFFFLRLLHKTQIYHFHRKKKEYPKIKDSLFFKKCHYMTRHQVTKADNEITGQALETLGTLVPSCAQDLEFGIGFAPTD